MDVVKQHQIIAAIEKREHLEPIAFEEKISSIRFELGRHISNLLQCLRQHGWEVGKS